MPVRRAIAQERDREREALRQRFDLRTIFPFATDNGHGRAVIPRPSGDGQSVVGLCPFHPRRSGTPSCVVWFDHWRCYGGCPEGENRGDLFDLVTRLERIDTFPKAIEFIRGHPSWAPGSLPAALARSLAEPQAIPEAPPPMERTVMDEYFQPLTRAGAEPLLRMGFHYEMLEFADVRVYGRATDEWGFPVYQDPVHHGVLDNVKIYHPGDPRTKWRPLFEGRGKQLYMASIARLALEDPGLLSHIVPNQFPWAPTLVVVESEKDELFLLQWGIPAIASGGASVWPPSFSRELYLIYEVLSDPAIVPPSRDFPHINGAFVLGDWDDAGWQFNYRVKKECPFVEIADWRLLRPDLPPGFDVAKFVKAGGERETMLKLLEATMKGELVEEYI